MTINPNLKTAATLLAGVVIVIGIGAVLYKTENNTKPSDPGDQPRPLNRLLDEAFPDVKLFDKDGNAYSVSSLKGRKVVLFFNEGIMCYPACWDQIAALATDERFNNDSVASFSVVTDKPQDWAKAADTMPDIAKAKFLFDHDAVVSGRLGLLNLPSSMHVGAMPGHTYIVLDKDGVVRYTLDDARMGNNNDAIASKMKEF